MMNSEQNKVSNNTGGDVVFRKVKEPKVQEEKIEKKELGSPKQVVGQEGEEREMAPTVYYETRGKPYLTKILGIENVYGDLGKEVKSQVKLIEEYFLKQVKKGKIDNTDLAYKEWWNKILETVGVEEFEPVSIKVKKVAEFLKYLDRVSTINYGKQES